MTLIRLRGGGFEIIKTVLAVSVMAILATGAIAPVLQDAHAHAQKAQLSAEKLKAKSYGLKTKDKISFNDSKQMKQNDFESIKKEQVKAYKKIVAEYSAKQILKNLYKLG